MIPLENVFAFFKHRSFLSKTQDLVQIQELAYYHYPPPPIKPEYPLNPRNMCDYGLVY